jgi:hypothetical protein
MAVIALVHAENIIRRAIGAYPEMRFEDQFSSSKHSKVIKTKQF